SHLPSAPWLRKRPHGAELVPERVAVSLRSLEALRAGRGEQARFRTREPHSQRARPPIDVKAPGAGAPRDGGDGNPDRRSRSHLAQLAVDGGLTGPVKLVVEALHPARRGVGRVDANLKPALLRSYVDICRDVAVRDSLAMRSDRCR